MVDMIAFGLGALGYDVDTATDGASAVAMARAKHYDVAITDLQMPKQDGIATMAALRGVNPGLKVIIITAYATRDMLSSCKDHGAAVCIDKPFTSEELDRVIDGLLVQGRGSATPGG
jgi:CheY-like chemotaxis protein